ncbi:MAG: hypothetical protein COU29_04115 [Candidatus Magasanikbacteria bacterium CG10_big_fil_rev_8_21_14_0_10_36_32]|uniref:Glycosyltransferase 2-like domain-containing protein n=1 Tax=Candidatus Magasanikbacteria bacterium CG10_big_fil_rev_8_21_14_0_10_36_32 TaxID=1974646 RepID=A0A2M6W5V1_9BACT|nr:MAG: hypothetical protein COU29_04115 [Candidatus Magasanikbacteria bacterium CG10_big_fil_rev_8_21_14_0_10_36_32]
MLTLITSSYKSEKYLKRYAAKITKAGDFLVGKIDFEFIVIANSPTKKEIEIFESLKKNKWFSYVEVPRESVFCSINRGINIAKGDVVGLWNVDDVRYPESLIDGLRLMNEGANVVYFPFVIEWFLNLFGFNFLIRRKIIKPPLFDREKFIRGMHCGPFFLIRKDFFKQIGPFDEQFKVAGDFDWCVRATKISDKFSLSEKIGGEFRVDGGGLSAGGRAMHFAENNIVSRRHGMEDKVVPGYENEEAGLRVDKIKFNGEYIDF